MKSSHPLKLQVQQDEQIPSLDWSNEGDVAYRGAEWIGAVVLYYFRTDRSRDFNFYLSDSYSLRNSILGTLLQLAIVAFILSLILVSKG